MRCVAPFQCRHLLTPSPSPHIQAELKELTPDKMKTMKTRFGEESEICVCVI